MSEQVELELKIKGGDKAVRTLGQLEKELNDAREAIKEVEVGSDAFNKLATQIQKASSEVKTLEKQMEGLEPQQKAEAFLKMGEGISGGFVAATGVMGLMGIESENLEKIQVKVQSAIAIAMGVRMMSEAALMYTTAERVAMEKIAIIQSKVGLVISKGQAIATTAWAAAQGVLTGAIGLSTGALKILKVAIVSTGIGALVVAIGALVGLSISWSKRTKEQTTHQQKQAKALSDTTTEVVKLAREYSTYLQLQYDIADAETENEKNLLTSNESYKESEERLKKRAAALEEYQRKVDKSVSKGNELTEFNKSHIAALTAQVEKSKENLKGWGDYIRVIEDKIEKDKEDAANQQRLDDEAAARAEKRKQRRAAEAAELLTLEQELDIMRIADEDEREQAKIEQDRQNAITKATNNREQILLINEKYDLLEAERKQKIQDEQDEKDATQREKDKEAAAKLAQEKADKEKEIAEKAADDQKELDQKVAAFKDSVGAQGFAMAKELGFKNKKIQKGIAVSETIFNTQKAVMRALADIPAPFGLVQAGIHGAMGAIAIRNILTEKEDVDVPDTPDNLTPATTGAFTLGGGMEQQAIKTYVITDEMSDSQAQLSDIRRRSTI